MAKRAQEEQPIAGGIEEVVPRSLLRRMLYVLLGIVGLLIIVQVLLWAGLSFKSITGEDLTLFLEVEHEYIEMRQGESADLNFTIGANNLPFCSAQCTWNVTDGSGVTVASGELLLERNRNERLGYEATANDEGTGRTLYQVQVSCSNEPAQYCQSSGKERYAAAVTVVNVSYAADEEQDAAELRESLPAWNNATERTIALLQGIAASDDARVRSVAQVAAGESAAWQEYATAMRDALANEDFARATNLLQQSPANLSMTAYDGLVASEQRAAVLYTVASGRQQLLDVLLRHANATDAGRLLRSARTAAALHDTFDDQPPVSSETAFSQFIQLTSELNRTYMQELLSRAQLATTLLNQEILMGCTIKSAGCENITFSPPSTLIAVSDTLAQRCTELQELPSRFASMHAAFAEQLNSTATTAEVEEAYNVTDARAEPGFAASAAAVRAQARNGTLLVQNDTLRLAIPLVTANATDEFIADSCSRNNISAALPQDVLFPSLPTAPKINLTFERATFTEPLCCVSGVCAVCTHEERYPVLFVHGHSFTATSAPEYSLNAFTQLARAFQQEGYLYAGHLFPRDDFTDVPYAELQRFPQGVAFTATYYYNSYPEEGETLFVARKSENLETYAIRLKEAIDAGKYKSGQDKVVIVAHSMGGLVSRRYLQLFGEQDTAALIMIGTPNAGILNSTESLCPLFGGDKECEDMAAGSIFLAKLNAGRTPTIPVHTFAGVGCSGRNFDGVVEANSVALPFAANNIIEGTCPSRTDLLHSMLLDPAHYPELYTELLVLVDNYTRP